MANILSDKNDFLSDFNPKEIGWNIAKRARQLRLIRNFTQAELSDRSGVSLGSLKRFERTGEISLYNLLHLALVLNATDEFKQLFETTSYNSVDEVLKLKKVVSRKRASKKQ
jgi:transcriptional regulator with XRE-family HTH domain